MAKIGILTDLTSFNQAYSVCNVVYNQCIMLERFGHDVTLLVADTYENTFSEPANIKIKHIVPRFTQVDYRHEQTLTEEHKQAITNIVPLFKQELSQYDIVFVHDMIYLGYHLPYFLSLEQSQEETQKVKFYHFIHSIPPRWDVPEWQWRDLNRLNKYNNHQLVSFTTYNVNLLKHYYKTDNVIVIPHIRDIRIENDFAKESWQIIDMMPNILQADIVSIYPASAERLRAKQVQTIIGIFDAFKRRNMSCALVCPNQWVTKRVARENLDRYKQFATMLNLKYGQEFIFTSEIPAFEFGLSKKILSDLYKCGNLFIFASIEETFGLTGLEAALNKQYIVANSDVGTFQEIYKDNVHYEQFASLEKNKFKGWSGEQVAKYLDEVAVRILDGMKQEKSIMCNTHVRQTYNLDKIYLQYYERIL